MPALKDTSIGAEMSLDPQTTDTLPTISTTRKVVYFSVLAAGIAAVVAVARLLRGKK